jgi:glycosyltransferase involved in cell wall biosynthesis
MKRLAIVTTHPVQYYAPVFRIISEKLGGGARVFYTAGKNTGAIDPGFQKIIEWDIPLLAGYDFVFLDNSSPRPSTSRFNGIMNPDAVQQISYYETHAVLFYWWSYQSHLSLMRHFSGKIPVWFRGDSTLLDKVNPLKAFIRKLWLREVYRNVAIAFYTGSANREYFKKGGLEENKLRFAPHAVDNERFAHPLCKEASDFRKQLSIPEKATVILFAGKFENKKDPLLLLEAFECIDDPSVYLLFTGNGLLETELKHRASAMKQKERVRFADFQNQTAMPAVYQSSDLFCLPSKGPGETWGLAVNEAMAAGKAVLVSDKTGCARDLVHPNINGEVFEAGNVEQLVEKLTKILSDKHRLKLMGMESKKIIKDWSFERQTDSFVNELHQL